MNYDLIRKEYIIKFGNYNFVTHDLLAKAYYIIFSLFIGDELVCVLIYLRDFFCPDNVLLSLGSD